jgi:hypothetical protein
MDSNGKNGLFQNSPVGVTQEFYFRHSPAQK